MRFRQQEKKSGDSAIVYEVEDAEKKVGNFAYHISENGDFRIDCICITDGKTSERIPAILEFLRYKADVSGCSSIYFTLNSKNHDRQQDLQQYGFYKIDEELHKGSYGEEICICTYKLRGREK